MEQVKSTLKDKIKKYCKTGLFLLIFSVFCFILNQNSQTLNYYLKRGTTLEYSINQNQNVNKEQLEDKLLEMYIKYSLIEEYEIEKPVYDSDGRRISKKLIVTLPYMTRSDKADIFNGVSDFVFKNYPDSKLLSLKVLGNLYSKKYAAIANFTIILLISFCLWAIIINIFSKENFFDEIKNTFVSFLKRQKQNIKTLFENTKKRGIGYFLKQILLDNNEDEKEENIAKEVAGTIIFVLIAVIIIRFFIGELRWIPTESMYPTIKKMDRVYVEKLQYPKRTIERGDILVFYPPEVRLSNSIFAIFSRLTGIFCKDMAYIKRTIGIPGDKFEVKYLSDIDEYRVFINDVALNEPYVNSIYNAGYEYPPKGYDGRWTPCDHPDVKYCGPFIIPEHKYFMMGDNRGNSADSRFWGFLDEDRIIGRANFMFWPLSRINLMRDKYIILDKEITDGKKTQARYILDRYSI